MKVLAFSDGHNSSAALFIDGELKLAIQEERFSRKKNHTGFPKQALDYLLQESGNSFEEIDHYLFVTRFLPKPGPDNTSDKIRAYKKSFSLLGFAKRVAKKMGAEKLVSMRNASSRKAYLIQQGVPDSKISFLEHHSAHSAAAYYGSRLCGEKVLVLTNDGAGDSLCATVSVGENGVLKRIAQVGMKSSVGELWALMTAMMGMVPLEHEYKLMGLAAYVDTERAEQASQIFKKCFVFDTDGMTWHLAPGVPPISDSYKYFRKELEFFRFDHICAGLQLFTEEFLAQWVKNCIAATGIRKVVLGGGTFMNVKANKRIMELEEVEDLFVFPSCGDETNPIGAGYAFFYEKTGQCPKSLETLYLGRTFSDEDIKQKFSIYPFKHKYKITDCPKISENVAKLLAEGKVVGWFQGREELGARALGARSLLADPAKTDVVREINAMIKCRDFWMPFALSILDSEAGRYIKNPKNIDAPFMILTFDTESNSNEIQGGIHPYDRTCRPQIVRREANPAYYEMISEFKLFTGRGAVLNTSLNLHGLPIASSPEDAFEVIDNSGLNYLAIGNQLIEKLNG